VEEYYKEAWTHGTTCAFELSKEWKGQNNHFVLKIFGHGGLPDVRINKLREGRERWAQDAINYLPQIESPEFEFPGADARDIVVFKLVKNQQDAGITATIGRATWDEMHKHLFAGVPLYLVKLNKIKFGKIV
jgi:hypothetical protein